MISGAAIIASLSIPPAGLVAPVNLATDGAGNPLVRVSAAGGLGVFGVAAPAARPAAYALNGPAPARAINADTAVAPIATAATSVAPFGYATAAQADAVRAGVAALIVDGDNTRAVLAQLITDLRAAGFIQ